MTGAPICLSTRDEAVMGYIGRWGGGPEFSFLKVSPFEISRMVGTQDRTALGEWRGDEEEETEPVVQ